MFCQRPLIALEPERGRRCHGAFQVSDFPVSQIDQMFGGEQPNLHIIRGYRGATQALELAINQNDLCAFADDASIKLCLCGRR